MSNFEALLKRLESNVEVQATELKDLVTKGDWQQPQLLCTPPVESFMHWKTMMWRSGASFVEGESSSFNFMSQLCSFKNDSEVGPYFCIIFLDRHLSHRYGFDSYCLTVGTGTSSTSEPHPPRVQREKNWPALSPLCTTERDPSDGPLDL